MVKNPPKGYTRVSPYLYYEKPAEALDWLKQAFGFTEKLRVPDPERGVAHAELELDGSVIMLGRPLDPDFKNPKNLGAKATASIYVYVDDVDEHYARAKDAGATILREPQDQFYGDRNYGVADAEGHEWYFATHVRDVTDEEMQAAMPATA